MKFETARNHFLSDVFVAVTVVVECLSSLFTVTQTPTSGGIFRLGGINDHTIKRLFHLSQCIKICRAKCLEADFLFLSHFLPQFELLKIFHFNSGIWIYVLLGTKRKQTWTFWGSPFSITIWLIYVIVLWQDQRPSTQNLLWNIIYNFGFKIQPVDWIFFASRKNISCTPCTPKISFLDALNRIRLNSTYIQVI